MHILLYSFYDVTITDLRDSLRSMGHTAAVVSFLMKEYDVKQDQIRSQLKKALNKTKTDAIMSYNFFPLVSDVAEEHSIPYISWMYDHPYYRLFTDALYNKCNYIFAFDHDQYIQLQQYNLSGLFHLPLAVNTKRLDDQLGQSPWLLNPFADMSFVGNLYSVNHNISDRFPDYQRGFWEGLLAAQHLIHGENYLYECAETHFHNVHIEMSPAFGRFVSSSTIIGDHMNTDLTKRERIEYLRKLAAKYSLTLYTRSDPSLIPEARYEGSVHFLKEMPYIFATTKVNLNFTLRTITSGIPLRALDVMGAGGFLLSNYQPELDTYFTDGEDLVMFESTEDLIDKAGYYLKNDSERRRIASNGWKKIRDGFTYQHKLSEIFQAVGLK